MSTWAPMKYRTRPWESKRGATIRRLRKGVPSRRLNKTVSYMFQGI